MKKREKAARALRKVCAVALVPAAVLAVAFVWRAALGNDPHRNRGENPDRHGWDAGTGG